MKLYVVAKKKHVPFHPTLRILETGYSRHHVCGQFWGADVGSAGMGAVQDYVDFQEIITEYFAELRRLGHVQVSEEEAIERYRPAHPLSVFREER